MGSLIGFSYAVACSLANRIPVKQCPVAENRPRLSETKDDEVSYIRKRLDYYIILSIEAYHQDNLLVTKAKFIHS